MIIKCYLGIGTIITGCHPDNQCHEAPLYVNVFLVFNVCFNILIVYILKFGSANMLFMASTVMVPVSFCLLLFTMFCVLHLKMFTKTTFLIDANDNHIYQIGNLAFALPFMPGSMPLKDSDVAGLLVILFGIVTYRFGNTFKCCRLLRCIRLSLGKENRYNRKDSDALLLNEEKFEWVDELNGFSNAKMEEPLLTPLE